MTTPPDHSSYPARLQPREVAGSDTPHDLPSGPPARSFLQVGATHSTLLADPHEAHSLFGRYHALQLDSMLEPAFLKSVLALCATSQWQPDVEALGSREVEAPQRAGRVLNHALNRPAILRWLERATGCGAIRSIEGRVVQMLNRPGDELHWHDDVLFGDGRRLAMTVGLSTEPFTGGEFEMRPKGGTLLFTHRFAEPGSALLFRIDRKLEHRVLPLTTGGPRRVFAACIFPSDQPAAKP